MINKCSCQCKCTCTCDCKCNNSKKEPNLILIGPPGAGKGSIASLLVKQFNYFQFSTGDMFRQEIKNKTELGKKIQIILDSGKYVDDAITNELVEKKLTELVAQNKPFILDGYPRTIDQAKFLEQLEAKNVIIDKVVVLKITDDQIIERLSKRRVCPACKTIYHLESFPPIDNKFCKKCQAEVIKRPDDEADVVLKRLAIYESQTKCLIDFYKNKNIAIEINSYQEFKKVYSDVKEALKW
ncbi:adenylate kinase [Mycoplasma enhydrae]|uniref:adenylate kinase n=1 Tax=Mycoplasma enhydrae TaxID=2499220 RepID=UPI00197BC52F|nr:adenylate kinase [Mycoplasma enhydrae]MBN4089600.1 adenylate kinase [Mycoplasma enhydrae]MCV3733806.1 adenylate kinase [Mycoplasma enhydrae]MCV3753550.1 adenylate kinase [Mycoplasma enhydrae]